MADAASLRWFTKGVYYWRTSASIFWSIWFSLPIIVGYRLLCCFSLFHPVDWVYGVAWFTMTLRCIVFFVLFYISLIFTVLLYSRICSPTMTVYKTRLSIIWSVVRPLHALVIIAFAVLGMIGNWSLAVLTGNPHYLHLWDIAEDDVKMINERMWFLIFLGGFSGMWYGVWYFTEKENYFTFPIIQQKKIFRLQGQRRSSLKNGIFHSVKTLRLFLPLYYLFGSYPRQFVMDVLKLSIDSEHQLNSLWGLMDIPLILQAIASSTVLFTLWGISLQLFNVFHTETIEFPVVAIFAGEAPRVIVKCLEAKSVPLLQHLGHLDLCQLSLYSAERRKQVFGLNQSGQSVAWIEICSQCVALLTTLTTTLGGQEPAKSVPAPTPSGIQPNAGQFQKGWPEPLSTATRRVVNNEKAKLWSTTAVPAGIQPVPIKAHHPDPVIEFAKNAYKKVIQFPAKVKEKLKKKPFFSYFLAELPDASLHELFVDAQLHTWAVKALSQLVVSSYTEDHYGVVQRSLPTVMSALVNLSQVVDKHTKGTLVISSIRQSTGASLQDMMMAGGRHSLKAALHSALHNITSVFNKELMVFQLSDGQHKYLHTVVGTKDNH